MQEQWRRKLSFIFLSTVLWAAPPWILADDAGPLSLGGRATYFAPKDGTASWYGGAQARLRLPLFFGVEGSVDYRRNTVGDTTIHSWPVQVSGLIYLPKIILVQPFLLAGVGWYRTTIEESNGTDDTHTQFGPHAGAGVEVNLSANWFIDATYRYIWLDKIDSTNSQQVSQALSDSGHMVTAGLNYRL